MPQLGARIPDELDAELTTRGDRSAIARQALEHHFALLRTARRRLSQLLTPDEQAAIASCFTGTFIDDSMRFSRVELPDNRVVPVLAVEVADCFQYEPVQMEQFDVQPKALFDKLAGLDDVAVLALFDAVERFWKQVGDGTQPDPRKLLAD